MSLPSFDKYLIISVSFIQCPKPKSARTVTIKKIKISPKEASKVSCCSHMLGALFLLFPSFFFSVQ